MEKGRLSVKTKVHRGHPGKPLVYQKASLSTTVEPLTRHLFFWGGRGERANRIMSMYRMKQNQAKRQIQRVPPLKGCSSGPEGD